MVRISQASAAPDNTCHSHIYHLSALRMHFIFNFIFVRLGSDNNIAEEDIGAADDEEEASDNNNNVPRGINRLSCKDQSDL